VFMLSPTMLLRLMLVVMVMALVLTRSRMGNVALLTALVLIGLPVMFTKGLVGRAGGWLLVSVLVIDVFILGNLIGVDQVVARLNKTTLEHQDLSTEESIEDRSGPAVLALNMVRERPLMGFGGGTFYTTYPRFNGPDFRRYYDHAHNDYVEIVADVGFLGAGLLAMVVISTVWRAALILRRPYSSLDEGVALGLLLAIAAILLQATVDFHFQVPANALTFNVLLALAWTLRQRAVVPLN
jgi:O-antigen ligase